MNILYWILVAVLTLVAFGWNERRKFYNNLTPFGILWETYANKATKESAEKLDAYIIEVIMKAQSIGGLKNIYPDITKYSSSRPFNFWRERDYSRANSEFEKCFNDKLRLIQIENEISLKKCNEEEAGAEAGRLKAAQDAITWEEARKVLEGNFTGRASTNLAIKKMNRFSLFEVLAAKTLEELKVAMGRAREDSLARKYVPFMYEKIAKSMVEQADTIDDLIAAAELAPTIALACNTALYISFLKIEARRHQEKK